jgi:CRP-like cAMP-binding protein
MPSGPTSAPHLELAVLLSTATLRLAPDVAAQRARHHLQVLKDPAGRRYLFVEAEHWPLLQQFAAGSTVPNVLCELIAENRCPPLREFYELVVAAYQQGILRADGEPAPVPPAPVKWWVRLPAPMARFIAVLALVGGGIVLGSTRVQMPPHDFDFVLGWVLACVAGSLGQVFAACVLAGAGCEVCRPRFDWKTPAPRFRVDLDDAVMGGPATEINVALARLAPPFLFAAGAALRAPDYFLPLLGGVFVQLSPWWRTPVLDLLRVSFGNPLLSTSTGFEGATRRPFALLAQARQQLSDRRFILARMVVTAGWLALVFVTGCMLYQANATELLRRFYSSGGLHTSGLAVAGVAAAVVLGIAGYGLWIGVRLGLAWRRERSERRRRTQLAANSPAAIAELLAGTVLFRDLPAEALPAVAAAMRLEEHARGDYLFRMNDPADRVYMMVAGRLDVIRHFAEDQAEAVAEMLPGDVLGEMGVIRCEPRSRSIRCATRCTLLSLDKGDFDRLVLVHVTRSAVEDAVQKLGFLQNVRLVKDWSHSSLVTFSRLAKIQEYDAGDVVTAEGDDNRFLYLVHRGEFAVTQKGRRLRQLTQGVTFGEIGMLQNNAATATVTATMPGSCLVVAKSDFLRFITHDFNLSLQFEEIGSKRLGHQLFRSRKGRSLP